MITGLFLQVGGSFATQGQTILNNIAKHHASQPATELIKVAKEGELKDLENALKGSYNIDEMAYEMTPLMHACKRGRIDMVKMLLEKGASPHIYSLWDNTPFREAVKHNHQEIIKLMLQFTYQSMGKSTWSESDFERSLGFALIQAAEDGRKDLVALLLKNGADVNAAGWSMSGMPTTTYALIVASAGGHEDIVRLLLENGANIHCLSSSSGNTALICAVANGHINIVKLLLNYGASTCIKNVWGQTALQIAQQHNNKEIIQLIEQYIKNPIGRVVRIMTRNANQDTPSLLFRDRNPHDYQDVYNLAINHPELMQGIIKDGRTFAMLCVERGYSDLLARLINENYPVDLTTPCTLDGPENPQTTILHILFREGHDWYWLKKPADYKASVTELIKLIINKYPDLLDMKLDRQCTARQCARNWAQI